MHPGYFPKIDFYSENLHLHSAFSHLLKIVSEFLKTYKLGQNQKRKSCYTTLINSNNFESTSKTAKTFSTVLYCVSSTNRLINLYLKPQPYLSILWGIPISKCAGNNQNQRFELQVLYIVFTHCNHLLIIKGLTIIHKYMKVRVTCELGRKHSYL